MNYLDAIGKAWPRSIKVDETRSLECAARQRVVVLGCFIISTWHKSPTHNQRAPPAKQASSERGPPAAAGLSSLGFRRLSQILAPQALNSAGKLARGAVRAAPKRSPGERRVARQRWDGGWTWRSCALVRHRLQPGCLFRIEIAVVRSGGKCVTSVDCISMCLVRFNRA